MAEPRLVGLERAGRRRGRVRVVVGERASRSLLGLAHREVAGRVLGQVVAGGGGAAVVLVLVRTPSSGRRGAGIEGGEIGISSTGGLRAIAGGASAGRFAHVVLLGPVRLVGLVELIRVVGFIDLLARLARLGLAATARAGGVDPGPAVGVASRRRGSVRVGRGPGRTGRGVGSRGEGDEHEQDHQGEPGEPPSRPVA